MSDKYYLKYQTTEGPKEATYENKDFYDAAKRYIIQTYGSNAILESKQPMTEGTVTVLSE